MLDKIYTFRKKEIEIIEKFWEKYNILKGVHREFTL